MTVQTTSGTVTGSVRTAYSNRYLEAAKLVRLYDQFAQNVTKNGVEQAAKLNSTVQVEFLSDMSPGSTAISEVADINPQTVRDATATITPTSRGEALQWSELLDLEVYTNYGEMRFKAIGKNLMETIEVLAKATALQGGLVNRAASRSSLDAGTPAHNLRSDNFNQAESLLQNAKCPAFINNGRSMWGALTHPDAFYDLRTSTDIVSVAYYQKSSILLNEELGEYGPFKISVSPWAKVFGAAGANNATSVSTTLSSAANALAITMVVASATSITAGRYLTVGTVETGNTFTPTLERVRVNANDGGTTTVQIIGEGANGGLRFPQASGATVKNADSVYTTLFGGPTSMAKLTPSDWTLTEYEQGMGEFGVIVGPKNSGILNQFSTLGWKWYGNYGRWVESWLVRQETSCSLDA